MIAEPEMSLSYTLTYSEFVAGYRLGVRQSPFALLPYIVALYIGPLVATLFLLLAIFSFTSGHRDAVAGTIPIILLCGSMPLIYLYSWKAAYKRLQGVPGASPRMTFHTNGTEFGRTIEGVGESTFLWSAADRMTANKKIVLVGRKGCFIIIPRHVISDAQLEWLRELHEKTI
jgi:hypothetical protein